ncbi:PREDICTED: thionin-like protein 2 [Ipomoea nil]|uniref:thionin-like protein 2 n=1 Tax=Ipomoea nil TaxID=35883 RepID=UPI0009013484|nr:PREDICTED: thionin-like protein 2 [Ipomoea nil]
MDVRKVMVVVLVGMGMLTGQTNASFKDCYAKCFIFCMIEPSQTLCSCTTNCLKQCIFNSDAKQVEESDDHQQLRNHNFCKLGCALSMCSSLSSKHQPNKEKMDGCVGSCSNSCTNNYNSSP